MDRCFKLVLLLFLVVNFAMLSVYLYVCSRSCGITCPAIKNQTAPMLGCKDFQFLAPLDQKSLPSPEHSNTAGNPLGKENCQITGVNAGNGTSLQVKNLHTSYTYPRWIGNIFNRKLGGIDGIHSSSQNGLNGSIGPSFMFLVFDALITASVDCGGHDGEGIEEPPVMIDIGASEGRVLMHWASYVQQEFNLDTIEVFGVELPH